MVTTLSTRRNAASLIAHARSQFMASRSGADETLQQIASLRYDVYCREFRFESRAGCLETDEFDHRSVHMAVHTSDNLLVGTVRLVRAKAREFFPFESHCPVFEHFQHPPREKCAEVSRLAINKGFRGIARGSSNGFFGDADGHHEGMPNVPRMISGSEILLKLYREIYRYSRAAGIRYWFAAMEKPLARSLGQMGFRFRPVGPETDYHGLRTPYVADLDQLEQRLRLNNPALSAWFHATPQAA